MTFAEVEWEGCPYDNTDTDVNEIPFFPFPPSMRALALQCDPGGVGAENWAR